MSHYYSLLFVDFDFTFFYNRFINGYSTAHPGRLLCSKLPVKQGEGIKPHTNHGTSDLFEGVLFLLRACPKPWTGGLQADSGANPQEYARARNVHGK